MEGRAPSIAKVLRYIGLRDVGFRRWAIELYDIRYEAYDDTSGKYPRGWLYHFNPARYSQDLRYATEREKSS